MFEQAAAQMGRQPLAVGRRDRHEGDVDGRAHRRHNWSNRCLIDHARSKICGKTVMIGIMRTFVNVLMQFRRGSHQAQHEDLDEGKPDQGSEYTKPAGLVVFRFHTGRRLLRGGEITRIIWKQIVNAPQPLLDCQALPSRAYAQIGVQVPVPVSLTTPRQFFRVTAGE